MTEQMICPICGEVTSSYMGHFRKDRLCRTHAIAFKNGEISQCEKCKKWHKMNEPCNCKRNFVELPT